MVVAGQLRHRVILQMPVQIRDRFGDLTTTWRDQAVVSAEVNPLTARERLRAEQIASDITHQVRMRYVPGVKAGCRLALDGARLLNVQEVIDPQERHRELQLLCVEVG